MNVGVNFRAGNGACQQRVFRRGAAAVELAISLPLLVLLVFGSMEVANGIFLNQALSVAAYEGVREAVRPGGTSARAQTRIAEILASRAINNHSVTIEPTVTDSTPRGTAVTVQVQAPTNSFVAIPVGILGSRISRQTACMVKH